MSKKREAGNVLTSELFQMLVTGTVSERSPDDDN